MNQRGYQRSVYKAHHTDLFGEEIGYWRWVCRYWKRYPIPSRKSFSGRKSYIEGRCGNGQPQGPRQARRV